MFLGRLVGCFACAFLLSVLQHAQVGQKELNRCMVSSACRAAARARLEGIVLQLLLNTHSKAEAVVPTTSDACLDWLADLCDGSA